MAIDGTNLGRTTLGTTTSRLLRFIQNNNRRLETLSSQLSSGRRILTPSMDASGTASWLAHQSMIRRNTQFIANAERLKQGYNFTDAQLGEAADILNQLKVIALRESNDSSDAQARAASADTVQQLRTALLGIANSRFAGQNLFGGRRVSGPVFNAIGSAIEYLGTDARNQIQVGQGVRMEATVDARRIFGVRNNVVTGRADLNARATLAATSPATSLAESTPLSALNGGRGVDLAGPILIQVQPDPASGGSMDYRLDISHAETIEDVVVAINQITDEAGNRVFDADLFAAASQSWPQTDENSASGIRITARAAGPLGTILQPGSRIRISDVAGRTGASDLGIATAGFGATFRSEDLSALGPFSGPFNFEMQVNGQSIALSVSPAAPNGLAELAVAFNASIAAALSGASIDNMTVTVTEDAAGGTLSFAVTDSGSGGYFELRGVNTDARDLRLRKSVTTVGPARALGSVDFSLDEGVLGRDLDPGLTLNTRLQDLFGGGGLALELDAAGKVRVPQGLRIVNGEFDRAIDLSRLIATQDATLADLKHAIDWAGVHVDLRISGDGRNLELVSSLSGTALKVADYNGTLATQLGVASTLAASRLADLNGGLGVDDADGVDFTLVTRNSVNVAVDLGGAATAAGMAAAINAAAANANLSGPPPTWFTASVLREREFETAAIADPTAALAFDVSFNGKPVESVAIPAAAGRTLAQLGAAIETALNASARRAGLDGYSVRAAADAGNTKLEITVEDAAGVARIAFTGGDTTALGLAGIIGADGESALIAERAADRLVIADNTFIPAAWSTGDPMPTISQQAGAGTVDDLGLSASFDVATGRFVSKDLTPRGQGTDGVFNVIADLVAALEGNSPAAIGRAIDRMQMALDAVLDGRAESGSRIQRLELSLNRLQVENENLGSLASSVMDVDFAQAALEFQQAMNVLQAGLAATARISQISVFDFL